MNDQEFLTQFELAKLSAFSHRDHIRIAWLYLQRDGWDVGYTHIQAGLKHFATSHNQPTKYHETITCFWSMLVHHAIQHQPEIDNFTVFEQRFPLLFDKSALKQHYSDDVLWSAAARQAWVAPDIVPMP